MSLYLNKLILKTDYDLASLSNQNSKMKLCFTIICPCLHFVGTVTACSGWWPVITSCENPRNKPVPGMFIIINVCGWVTSNRLGAYDINLWHVHVHHNILNGWLTQIHIEAMMSEIIHTIHILACNFEHRLSSCRDIHVSMRLTIMCMLWG